MRISDWSSDVCSSDLVRRDGEALLEGLHPLGKLTSTRNKRLDPRQHRIVGRKRPHLGPDPEQTLGLVGEAQFLALQHAQPRRGRFELSHQEGAAALFERSEEHTSELQSLMRISYAVFCLKKKKNHM